MNDKQKEQVRKLRSMGYGYGKISDLMSLSVNSVKSFCRRNDLGEAVKPTARPEVYPDDMTFCTNCGNEIRQTPKRKKKKFCCDRCRREWWNSHPDEVNRKAYYEHTCQGCGKTFTSYGDRNRKYCCHECYVKDRFGKL